MPGVLSTLIRLTRLVAARRARARAACLPLPVPGGCCATTNCGLRRCTL